jgi:hypothetical protein
MNGTQGMVGGGVSARLKKRHVAFVAALVVLSSMAGVAVGRATSDGGSSSVGSTTLTGGRAVAGHPVFEDRYAGHRA